MHSTGIEMRCKKKKWRAIGGLVVGDQWPVISDR
jgi:hypothetical protein